MLDNTGISDRDLRSLVLTDNEWDLVGEMIDFLKVSKFFIISVLRFTNSHDLQYVAIFS